MLLKLLIFILMNTLLVWSQVPTYRVVPHGMKFKTEDPAAYLSAVHQIESDGQRIYFRGGHDRHLLVTELDGKVQALIGGTGGHPSEFGANGVLAIAVSGNTLSAIDKDLKYARFYKDLQFVGYQKLHSYNAGGANATSNVFAFSDDYLVAPCRREKSLALAYSRKGDSLKGVGDHLDIPVQFPTYGQLNATLWCHDGTYWYAAHKYFPIVTVFDEKFNLVNQFSLDHPKAKQYIEYLSEFQPNERFSRPSLFISDAKVFKGRLYLMVQGVLFQCHLETGKVLSTSHFIGEGAHFGVADGKQVYLPLFAFSEDGRLFAAHPALLWEHDFWAVDLPFLKAPDQL